LRYAIFGDIHGNYDAFGAMLADAARENINKYICLGDIVGYGAQPKECIDKVKELGADVVAGNHDWAVAAKINIDFFNPYAKESVYWTRRALSPADLESLANFPLALHYDDFTVVHGTLHQPEMFCYIQTNLDAILTLQLLERSFCFMAHSHVPVAFFESEPLSYSLDPVIQLDKSLRSLVNVGSIGQPRDLNPKLAYSIYDSETDIVVTKRLDYDIEAASEKIIRAGLPKILADRLFLGQ